MAITSDQLNAFGGSPFACGHHKDTAGSPAAITLTLGFTPTYVKMVNVTTIQAQEWFFGMGAADAFKTANHDTAQHSLLTSGGITVDGGTVTLPAPAQNDQIYWIAQG